MERQRRDKKLGTMKPKWVTRTVRRTREGEGIRKVGGLGKGRMGGEQLDARWAAGTGRGREKLLPPQSAQ